MRTLLAALVVVLAIPSVVSVARAEQLRTIRSYWSSDRTSILSDVEITHDDGSTSVEQVLGGSVDGIGMIQFALYARPGVKEFVPTRSTAANRLHWGGSCILLTPDSAGSSDIADDDETKALAAAAQAWNDATSACGYMMFQMMPAEPLEVGLDGKNILKFREQEWCRPAHGDVQKKCYDDGATAITTLMFIDKASRPDDGLILDADIEVNSVNYAMAVSCERRCVTMSTRPIVEDLQNTLTHELGHILGLDHTCWAGKPDESPLDANGTPAPMCDAPALPSSVIAATMYNYQDPREVKKRTPEADDANGVCTNYPLADDPKFCEPVDVSSSNGCCSVAGGRPHAGHDGAALLGGLLAALGLVWRRTRRRQSYGTSL